MQEVEQAEGGQEAKRAASVKGREVDGMRHDDSSERAEHQISARRTMLSRSARPQRP